MDRLRVRATIKRLLVMIEAFEQDEACQYLKQTCLDAATMLWELEAKLDE